MAVAPTLRSVLILTLLSMQGEPAIGVCPTVGSSREDDVGRPGSARRLLLDVGRPAQCSGTVTAWRYCAYVPSIRGASAVFMAFEMDSTDGTTYRAINESVMEVSMSRSDFKGNVYICRTLNLAANETFSIERNAIVGACVVTNSERLNVASQQSSSPTDNIYRVDDAVYDNCPISVLTGQSVNINGNPADEILHLEAQIASSLDSTQCQVGSTPTPTVSSDLTGTFLDVLHPSPCTGLLMAWNYCYYSDIISLNNRGTYSVDVGVWFYNRVTQGYDFMESSRTTISIELAQQQIQDRSPSIFCGKKAVSSDIEVVEGNVVGAIVNASTSMRLPLLGSGLVDGDYVLDLETSQNRSLRIHLSAVIQLPLAVPSFRSSSDVAVSVSVVVVVLVLLVAATAAVLMCLFWRNRRMNHNSTQFKSYGDADPGVSGNFVDSEGVHKTPVSAARSNPPPAHPPAKLPSKPPPPRPALPTRLMKPTGPPPRPVHKTVSAPLRTENNPPRSSIKTSTLARSPEYAELSKIYPDGKEDAKYAMLLQRNVDEDVYGSVPHYMLPATDRNSLYAQLKTMKTKNIKRDMIRITGHLGSGQFGNVEKGEWRNGSKKLPVALKTLNRGSSQQNIVMFLQEAAIMAQFNHPNVINLYGVVTEEEEPVLVVEFADGGDLKQHLKELSVTDDCMLEVSQLLLRFSQQIAFGMQYLSRKGFIHRDLAARNILVFGTKICKIADFGMSRDLPVDGIYVSSGGVIPLKWTALEAIHYKEFSTASDVWSYGCVLYEIWSLGHKPFEFEEIGQKVIRLLRSGVRLPPPPGCPRAIYTIMIRAWHPDPDERPSFRQIVVDLVDSRGEKNTLYIPEEDLDSHEDAGRLGAELEVGAKMYRDLQDTYR